VTIYQHLSHEFSPIYKRLEEKERNEGLKVQWINLLRYNSFVNRWKLPLFCKNTGAIMLALPGLMAGWLAGWQAGRQNSVKFRKC